MSLGMPSGTSITARIGSEGSYRYPRETGIPTIVFWMLGTICGQGSSLMLLQAGRNGDFPAIEQSHLLRQTSKRNMKTWTDEGM